MTLAVLILGGTQEAAALAARLEHESWADVTTSLAGRTTRPRPIAGQVRVGGFGGAEGLAAYLRDTGIDVVVDATHPFAAQISAHAAEACDPLNVGRLQLRRGPWEARAGDRWIRVASMEAALAAPEARAGAVFVTTGHGELARLCPDADARYVVRLVEPPKVDLSGPGFEVILARGPFREEDEIRLLREHGIDAIVSKNSGGSGTYAKIAAARALGIPVVMIEPPEPAPGPVVGSVDAAHAWLRERHDTASPP